MQDQRFEKEGYGFSLITDESLPFPDASFDVVISNQVLEHVWNQERHIAEIHRVLKADGVAYLSTPNRFTFVEPHYHLPLLAWFGDAFATRYLRLIRGTPWDVKLLSFRALQKLLTPQFHIHDAIPTVMRNPLAYSQTTNPTVARWLPRVPSILWSPRINPFLPSFMLVLRKRNLE